MDAQNRVRLRVGEDFDHPFGVVVGARPRVGGERKLPALGLIPASFNSSVVLPIHATSGQCKRSRGPGCSRHDRPRRPWFPPPPRRPPRPCGPTSAPARNRRWRKCRSAGLEILIHFDEATFVGGHTKSLEVEAIGHRPAANGDQHAIGFNGFAIAPRPAHRQGTRFWWSWHRSPYGPA